MNLKSGLPRVSKSKIEIACGDHFPPIGSRSVNLSGLRFPASTIETTRIGFGCSNLLGDKTRDEGLRLLHTAYDCGIRHFDVARVYNFGDAEFLVGEFQSGKRDKITITTKFGLIPSEGVAKLKGTVQLARRIMRSSSFVRRLVRKNVRSLTQAGRFNPTVAQASLDTSLRALRTDYIDVYLLHEAFAKDCTVEILHFLQSAIAQGKIRAYGVGSGYGKIEEIARENPAFLQTAQFESSLTQPNIKAFDQIRPQETSIAITHGALSAAKGLREKMSSDSTLVGTWSKQLGVDLADPSKLHAILLQYSLFTNPKGGVIFRASTQARIKSNIESVSGAALNMKQVDILEKITASTLI